MRVITPVVLSMSLALTAAVSVEAQDAPPQGQGQKRPPPKPTPRWPDGRVSFSGTPERHRQLGRSGERVAVLRLSRTARR